MKLILNLIIIIITFLPLGIVMYKLLKDIIDYIKHRKTLSESKRAMFEFLMIMYIIPIVIYQMDKYNLFSFFKLTENINTNYDWLSFIGTFISTWVSAFLLIYVTREDRIENNENVRESQRPCLCTIVYSPYNSRTTDTSVEGYICQSTEKKNTSEYNMIRISNSGQTVAIIDTEKSYIVVDKFKEEIIKQKNKKSKVKFVLKEEKVYLKKYEDRLQIQSNGKIELIITDEGMYRGIANGERASIKEVYIEYKDLFGKCYKDHVKIEEDKTKVISDNEILDEC